MLTSSSDIQVMKPIVFELCSISNGLVLSMETEIWSFFPPQHLLGIPQLLPGLLHVKSRASSPFNNCCPEPHRFACMISTHLVVSSRLVKSLRTKNHSQWMTYSLSTSFTHPKPSTANIACALAITASLGCCSPFFSVIPMHTHAHAMESLGTCLDAKSRSAL